MLLLHPPCIEEAQGSFVKNNLQKTKAEVKHSKVINGISSEGSGQGVLQVLVLVPVLFNMFKNGLDEGLESLLIKFTDELNCEEQQTHPKTDREFSEI